jgi:aryl-alcohol dehydrogenase-like predicted oxidoreductase
MTVMSNLSRIGLGCSRIGSFNNPQSLAQSEALLGAALEMGVTCFDTSNIYGQGDSERAIGRVLRGAARDRAFVLTKGGLQFSMRARAVSFVKPVLRPLLAMRGKGGVVTAYRGSALDMDWRPEALLKSLDGSLRRLGMDYVDGFVLHSPPAFLAGDAGIDAALGQMQAQDKARLVGISCDDLETLRAAMGLCHLSLLELPVGVIAQMQAQTPELAEQIVQRGIVVVAREVIRMRPDLAPVEAVRACLAEPVVACALVGTGNPKHLAQLVEAASRGAGA